MTATVLAGGLPTAARRSRRVLGLGGALLALVVVTSSGLAIIVAGLLAAALIATAVWRHPGWAMVSLVALLPIDRFLILLVFHTSGSRSLTLGVQLWKDLVVLVLLARAIDVLLTSHDRPRLRLLDLLVVAFLAMGVLYLLHPGPGVELTPLNRILGFRADALFLLAYVAGRAIPLDRRQARWLLVALIPGTLVVAAVAAAQFTWPTAFNDFFERLGYQDFAGGVGEIEAIRSRGIAGVDLPRAGSLLLSDLALGFFAVFAVAVSSALFFTARRTGRAFIAGIATGAAMLTAVLTITRSAVLAALLVVVVMGVMARAPARAILLLACCALGALVALSLNVIPASDIGALADPEEESVQAHVDAITGALAVVEEQPMGRGLGTAGTIGQRFVPERAVTSENWFLQIATEMGAIAGVLFLTITAVAAGVAAVASQRLPDVLDRRIALAVTGASAGFFLLANVLHLWEVAVLAMSYWMLVGVVASADDRRLERA